MPEEKTLADNITDWFKILIKEGVPGLLVGLGFVLVLFGGVMYGGSNPPAPGFWSMTLLGAIMLLLGAYFFLYRLRKNVGQK